MALVLKLLTNIVVKLITNYRKWIVLTWNFTKLKNKTWICQFFSAVDGSEDCYVMKKCDVRNFILYQENDILFNVLT